MRFINIKTLYLAFKKNLHVQLANNNKVSFNIKTMKKVITLLVLLIATCAYSFATTPPEKGNLTGKVVDSKTNQPVEYATVAVYSQPDNTLITGTITDAQGVFLIQGLKAGTYSLKASFIGYDPLEITDIVIGNGTKQLGLIKLATSDAEIEEVEVTAKKNHVEYKIDKKIVNIASDINADNGSAAEALEGVPSVDVDIDGNVSLRGSSNFTVLIDGKPTALDATEVLKQTPAAMIENIEIITNPSAKYDPEGSTGIINLVTKKNVVQGINGVVNANIGNQGRYGGDFLFNMKKDKINYFVGGYYNHRGFNFNGISNRITHADQYDKYVNQDNFNKRRFGGGGLKAGVDIYPNDANSINITIEGGLWNSNNDGSTYYKNWYYDTDILSEYDYEYVKSNTDDGDDSKYYNISSSWQHNFAKKGHKLNLNAFYSRNHRDADESFLQYKSAYEDYSSPEVFGHNVDNIRDNDRSRVNFDYTLPFGDNGKFEAGYQGEFTKTVTDYDFNDYDNTTQQYITNTEFTNDVTFERYINAIYSTVSKSFGKFGVQLGLRGEYTYRNITSPKEPDHDKYKIDRFDIFPTLHLSQQIGERNSLQFGYSRRIRRPWDNFLNPFPMYADEFSRRIGNPALKPEYTDALELNYQMNFDKMFWALETFYRHTDGQTENVSTLATDGSDILISRFENLSDNNNFGVELTGNYDPVKWFSVNIDFELRQYYIKGNYNGQDLSRDGNSWRTKETFSFNPTKTTKIQFTMRYNGRNKTLISDNKGNFDAGLAIRQSFFKKRLSASLSMRDIFGTRRNESTTDTPEYYLYTKRYRDAPMWNIGLSFKINNFKEKFNPNGEGGGSSYEGDSEGGMDF